MGLDVPWPDVTGSKDEGTNAAVMIIRGGISGMYIHDCIFIICLTRSSRYVHGY